MTVSNEHESNTPTNLRDRWCTPQYLFNYADSMFNFDFDLAADEHNAKCKRFFTEEDDSLQQNWHDYSSSNYLNPPYSSIKPWVEKAWLEAQKGATVVLLIPCDNGESYWGDFVWGKASHVINIQGRVAFEAAGDFIIPATKKTPEKLVKKGESLSGNPRGSSFVIYNRRYEAPTIVTSVKRDDIKREFS